MFEAVVRSYFDAAHALRGYAGKCARLHGHRWTVEVAVQGSKLDPVGMLVDFGDIKAALEAEISALDHRLLNDLPEFAAELNPTAENLAQLLFTKLNPVLRRDGAIRLAWVKVYESPDTWVVYRG